MLEECFGFALHTNANTLNYRLQIMDSMMNDIFSTHHACDFRLNNYGQVLLHCHEKITNALQTISFPLIRGQFTCLHNKRERDREREDSTVNN